MHARIFFLGGGGGGGGGGGELRHDPAVTVALKEVYVIISGVGNPRLVL